MSDASPGRSRVSAADAYARHVARMRERSASLVAAGQDIGAIPPVRDPARRVAAESSLRVFCETYFPKRFRLAWSRDHHRVLRILEGAVLHGGLFAFAMPRGSGKTTICEVACLWAPFIGAHRSVLLVGATDPRALKNLNNLRKELEGNALLAEDFPEIVWPIRRLQGESRRQAGQRHLGARTMLRLDADEIQFPTIPGSAASGAIVRTAGILGNIRGAVDTLPDGTSARPTLVIVDDPQTDGSARSPLQCAAREAIVAGAILNLAPPDEPITVAMPCTVVRDGDMADRMLDRDLHPEWRGERMRLVYRWPEREDLWAEYDTLRGDSFRSGGKGEEATAFYARNREEMDRGADLPWPERFERGTLSAIQHARNLRLRDPALFEAEYQNDPVEEAAKGIELLSADEIAAKTNGRERGEIPDTCTRLTLFVDVGQSCLWWAAVAWDEDFTGYVVDYSTWPRQTERYFTAKSAKRTLMKAAPRGGLEAAIHNALERLAEEQVDREWRTESGTSMRVARMMVDANWDRSRDPVYLFCRQSRWAGSVTPHHGRFVGVRSRPWHEYRRKRGERVGLHWRMPFASGRTSVRYVNADVNWWKSFVHERLAVPIGDPGCLSLFGRRADEHRMLADHLVAEERVRAEANGRVVDEWTDRVPKQDNHWFDCIVGAAVAASFEGARFGDADDGGAPRPRRRIVLSEIQRRRR